MVKRVHGIQNESCDCEADETEGSQETEDTVDEDGDATISVCVVAEIGDKSLRELPNCWLEFLPIFYLE